MEVKAVMHDGIASSTRSTAALLAVLLDLIIVMVGGAIKNDMSFRVPRVSPGVVLSQKFHFATLTHSTDSMESPSYPEGNDKPLVTAR